MLHCQLQDQQPFSDFCPWVLLTHGTHDVAWPGAQSILVCLCHICLQIRPADLVMVFTLPEQAAVSRLVERGKTSGRADDNEETIRSRMQVFVEESQPVIDALKESGRVAEIDAQGSVDDVFGLVEPIMDSLCEQGECWAVMILSLLASVVANLLRTIEICFCCSEGHHYQRSQCIDAVLHYDAALASRLSSYMLDAPFPGLSKSNSMAAAMLRHHTCISSDAQCFISCTSLMRSCCEGGCHCGTC